MAYNITIHNVKSFIYLCAMFYEQYIHIILNLPRFWLKIKQSYHLGLKITSKTTKAESVGNSPIVYRAFTHFTGNELGINQITDETKASF